jgi:hypothetical protein
VKKDNIAQNRQISYRRQNKLDTVRSAWNIKLNAGRQIIKNNSDSPSMRRTVYWYTLQKLMRGNDKQRRKTK